MILLMQMIELTEKMANIYKILNGLPKIALRRIMARRKTQKFIVSHQNKASHFLCVIADKGQRGLKSLVGLLAASLQNLKESCSRLPFSA